MSPSQIIVLATPVFLALIAIEYAVGRARGRDTYRFNDAVSSIGLGMLSQISAVFTRLLRVGVYTAVFASVSLVQAPDFWTSPQGWLLALVFYDFCYYWLHRLGHTCALLWAAHVVHHQSEDYNLSTALRQTSSGALLGWVFYLPMAVAGVPPLVFGVVALVDLLYQYWIRTQQIGSMGRFDRVFASPSNHRVHHAVNDRYLDKNFGGVLMLWDHLFGSFQAEDPAEPCVYGTRSPLRSWDPLWANLEVYVALWRESRRARHWGDRWRVWWKPPGWQSADMALHSPRPAFDLSQVQRCAPSLPPGHPGFRRRAVCRADRRCGDFSLVHRRLATVAERGLVRGVAGRAVGLGRGDAGTHPLAGGLDDRMRRALHGDCRHRPDRAAPRF